MLPEHLESVIDISNKIWWGGISPDHDCPVKTADSIEMIPGYYRAGLFDVPAWASTVNAVFLCHHASVDGAKLMKAIGSYTPDQIGWKSFVNFNNSNGDGDECYMMVITPEHVEKKLNQFSFKTFGGNDKDLYAMKHEEENIGFALKVDKQHQSHGLSIVDSETHLVFALLIVAADRHLNIKDADSTNLVLKISDYKNAHHA